MKYAAQIQNVREVALTGTADLGYWTEQLKSQGLVPVEHRGHARLLITGTNAKFGGFGFRELGVGVFATAEQAGSHMEGLLLLHAFNSNRFFAFIERTFFSTPYYRGNVQVEVDPVRFALIRSADDSCSGRLGREGATVREAETDQPGGWSGPIFLPGMADVPHQDRKWFFAQLSGQTRTWAFQPGEDELALPHRMAEPVFAWMLESGFAGLEWTVRTDAKHGKSKTYRRSQWGEVKLPVAAKA